MFGRLSSMIAESWNSIVRSVWNEENHMQVMAITTGVGIFAIVGMLAMLPSLLSQARQRERDSFSRGGHSDAPWRSGLTVPSARPYRSPSFSDRKFQ